MNHETLQQQLIDDLLIESFDGLDRFDREMLALEKNEGQPDTLNIVFRVIHTIKGTAGCIGLGKIESVAHVGENLLSLLRDDKLKINPPMIAALLEYSDALKEMLRCLEKTGQQGDADYTTLLDKLKKLQAGEPLEQPAAAVDQSWGLFDDEPAPAASGPPAVSATPSPAVQEKVAAVESAAPRTTTSVSDTAIRVDVGQLDKLMTLVGELVLARNQILQFTGKNTEPSLLNAAQRLNGITTELQESVMKTRMQPIENVWSKFPRIVRDIAHELGKRVKLVMEGQETELDRTIIEAIKDPLTHIIRNAIDHGVEKPDVRGAGGKPEEGLLVLRAFHEGGQVIIEIMDDGQGINVSRVKQKALEKGLLTAEQVAAISDHDVFNLIFLPGFSTAEKVTNVSGRGVGMDVVKTNIEKIGGSVDVFSELGQGTTLKIKVPLTLAIIPALIVASGNERFAIPQVNLIELVRLEGEQACQKIESLYGSPVYRLRGQLLPLAYLNKTLAGADQQQLTTSADWHMSRAGDAGGVFIKARDAHRAWLGKLRHVLDGSLKMTLEEAGSHKLCSLGKWLYSEGLKDYAGFAEIHALAAVHEQFHNFVKDIVAHKNAGDQKKAENEFRELTAVSKRIFGSLADLEKKVLESQNVNIVVLHADGRQFGLVVDAINDTEEIVVKPLGKMLKGIPCFAGATIMGDGRVALILDVIGLAQTAKIISETGERMAADKDEDQTRLDERQTLLLFTAGENSRLAIPLSAVARLEEFPLKSIERAGGQEVVQYRGQILPLINVAQMLTLDDASMTSPDPVQVVVYSESGRSVGLRVGKISDIVHEALTVKRNTPRHGICGSAVIQSKVTDLLDVPGIIRASDPSFYLPAENTEPATA